MSGRAWVFGADVDTDQLAPGAYMAKPLAELAKHCLEAVDPGFAPGVRPGDVVVAGANFGMGSSREQAAEALRHLGVAAVLAPSFAGIFHRNALNLGLLALVCPEAGRIAAGDRVSVDGIAGRVVNETTGAEIACEPLPAFLMEMVAAGGLIPHLEAKLKGAS